MSKFSFKEIDEKIEKQIVEIWGEWVVRYGCLHYEAGCYSLAALYDNKPIGFISTYPLQFPTPLHTHCDAYIDDIEVLSDFRRMGVARKLITMTEQWAKNYGYRQIRSWSTDDHSEAISMWYSLGYGICPAIMRGNSVIKELDGTPIYGFYVVKPL